MKNFTLRNFLTAYNGAADKLLLSYDDTNIVNTSKLNTAEYDKWVTHVNREFELNTDSQHSLQKIDDFLELKPFLEIEIMAWQIFQDGVAEYDYKNKKYTCPGIVLVTHLEPSLK